MQHYQYLEALYQKDFLSLVQVFAKNNVALFCVGGCVRDALLAVHCATHQDSKGSDIAKTDIDCAVPIPPQEVISILEKENISYFAPGLQFGTVIAHYHAKNFEITSFRSDIKTDGRHAEVAFCDDMILDAQRRDFTINALYYDPLNKIVYDPTQSGIKDLGNRSVCFIGSPHHRIQEDYLRILRYFRFLSYYGFHSYQPDIFKMNGYTKGLSILSVERVAQELDKMIAAPFADQALNKLEEIGYSSILFPDLKFSLSLLRYFQQSKADKIYLYASLFYQNDSEIIRTHSLFTKKQRSKIIECHKLMRAMLEHIQQSKWIDLCDLYYTYDAKLWHHLVMWLSINKFNNHKILSAIKTIQFPPFTITGSTLIAQGHKQGPHIAELLEQKRHQHIKEVLISSFPEFFMDLLQ